MALPPDPSTALLPFRSAAGAEPLRVGIVVDTLPPARWVEALVAFLRGLPGVEAGVFTASRESAPPPARPSWLTGRLYDASRRKFDGFASGEPGKVSGLPLPASDCGLIVWLASAPAAAFPSARYGVLTVAFGSKPQAVPFWDEVLADRPVSPTAIYWHDDSLASGRPIRRVETATTQGLYFTSNAEEPVAAAIRLIAGVALELRENSEALAKFRQVPAEPLPSRSAAGYPSTFSSGRFLARKFARSAWLRWRNRGLEPRWIVAARPASPRTIADTPAAQLSGFVDVPLPLGSEAIADPFLYEAAGHTWLLFEDVPAGQPRARLSCMELLENGRCSDREVVLERGYHLSYPCVIESGGELFLMPETSEANRVELYRFRRFPSDLEPVAVPIDGIGLVDTTPICLDGIWYFFTTTVQPFMESLLFWSDRLDGNWRLHPASPISCSVRNSRGAGNLFRHGGRLFRPTQDCSVRYGYAMTVNEITRLTPTEFAERQVNWVGPSWAPGLLATHTWNQSSRFQVMDAIRLTRV